MLKGNGIPEKRKRLWEKSTEKLRYGKNNNKNWSYCLKMSANRILKLSLYTSENISDTLLVEIHWLCIFYGFITCVIMWGIQWCHINFQTSTMKAAKVFFFFSNSTSTVHICELVSTCILLPLRAADPLRNVALSRVCPQVHPLVARLPASDTPMHNVYFLYNAEWIFSALVSAYWYYDFRIQERYSFKLL